MFDPYNLGINNVLKNLCFENIENWSKHYRFVIHSRLCRYEKIDNDVIRKHYILHQKKKKYQTNPKTSDTGNTNTAYRVGGENVTIFKYVYLTIRLGQVSYF